MDKRGDGLGFLLEVLGLGLGEMGMQHFDGGLLIEPQVLPKVHLGEAALSQQAHQPVVAELLSGAVCHLRPPDIRLEASIRAQIDRFSEENHEYCRVNTHTRQASVQIKTSMLKFCIH